ncbi:MAG: glycosyltransferase [Anaerolineaceae bacterium]|nr:glycosyltransferase [Anaerolineaceae bacterium]
MSEFSDKRSSVILSVGRLTPIKGYPVLLAAFQKVIKNIDSRLIIIGGRNDQYLEELKAIADDLEISEKVCFVGEKCNPYAYMRQSDLFVLASNTEGFGVVLIEAMACSLPVVATATAGAAEVLANGRYGQLVPVGDSQKLACSIIKELKNQRQHHQFVDYTNQFDRSQIVKLYISYMSQDSKRK